MSTVDKSTGKENKITNANDKLSKKDIECMVQEAGKYKAENEKQHDNVSSKNSLKFYAFNMKTTFEDEKPQAILMMKTNRRFLTSVTRSSIGLL